MSRSHTVIVGVALFVAVVFDAYLRLLMDSDLMLSNARNTEACKELATELRETREAQWERSRRRM